MAKNVFYELEKLYNEIDQSLTKKELEARRRRHSRKEQFYQKRRELNDQAFFLYMFTRLEDHIRVESIALIEHQYNTLTNWANKRVWDILYPRREDGITFMNRVGLLVAVGQAHYNKINTYYKQRNKVAHGGLATISMPTVISDMKVLYKAVKA